MKLKISSLSGIKFSEVYLPKLIFNLYLNYTKDIKGRAIEEYVKTNYNLSIEEIYRNILNYLDIREINNYYIIEFNKNKYFKGYKFIDLINLIDNGVLNTPGVNISLRVFNYINNNIKFIYRCYKIKEESNNGS